MSIEAMKQVIRNGKAFKANQSFRCCDARFLITKCYGEVSSQRAAEVLRDMVKAGELNKQGNHYQRRNTAREHLRRPWRTISNQELGIESMQFGVQI